MIEGQAVLLAPKDTGRLQGSITYATDKVSDRPRHPAKSGDAVSAPNDEWTLHVGTNVEYAEYQEYGTRFQGSQPFLRPALDRYRKAAQTFFAASIRKAILAYGK